MAVTTSNSVSKSTLTEQNQFSRFRNAVVRAFSASVGGLVYTRTLSWHSTPPVGNTNILPRHGRAAPAILNIAIRQGQVRWAPESEVRWRKKKRMPFPRIETIASLFIHRDISSYSIHQSQTQRQSYFTTGGLPPISSSWRQAAWGTRSQFVFFCNWTPAVIVHM
jgi:hypothetical protein